jgi:hypothetical protein
LEDISFRCSENLWNPNRHHFHQRKYLCYYNLQCRYFKTPNRAVPWTDTLQSDKKWQTVYQRQLYSSLRSYTINSTSEENSLQ